MSVQKIKEQIEYYFSDANYSKDKFLQETASKNNKCIPIQTLLTFTRMKTLQATVELVKEAAKDISSVELIDDSIKKIETEEYLEYIADPELSKRVVYMKGFNTEHSLDDLKEFLKPYCSPVKITMRRDANKNFKGSCFVEFATKEEASKALELKIESAGTPEESETVKKSKVEPTYILIMTKDDYLQSKVKPDRTKKSEENFANKVKSDFIPKLYRFEAEGELQISTIKEIVPNVAFVDIANKIIRMKYREEWDEKEFGKDDKKIKLTKMSEEDATAYVKDINIKKTSSKRK